MTNEEAYSNEDNLSPRHNYQWAVHLAKEGFHCVNFYLQHFGYRLVYAEKEVQIRKYDKRGWTVNICTPSEMERNSKTWRLWKEGDQ